MPSKTGQKKIKKRPAETKRRIKQPVYKSFRYSKRIRQPKPEITGAFRLFFSSTRFVMTRWRLFGGITLIYLILTMVLVRGFVMSGGLGDTAQNLFESGVAPVASSLTLFGMLVGGLNVTDSEAAGAYQSILIVVISLALIWALRNSSATKKIKITVKDAFYKSLYPFVPFLLVLIVIGLQLVPLLAASFLYTAVFGGGLAVTALEKGLWLTLLALMMLLSLYMISSSFFALYIVTLPDVAPMQALKSARDLVRHRRANIMRKLLFLPLAMLLLAALIILPVVIISPGFGELLFFVLTMIAPAVGHSYLYHLYRELL